MNLLSIKISLASFIMLVAFGFSSFTSTDYQKTNFTTLSTNFLQDTTDKDSIIDVPVLPFQEYTSLDENQIFTIVEQPATYPNGGMTGFYEYVDKNLVYPKQAKRMGIQGRVFVQFIVDKDGQLIDIKTVKGIGGGCDEEAERLLRESIKWIPAKQRGKTVKVKMNLPFLFKLDKE